MEDKKKDDSEIKDSKYLIPFTSNTPRTYHNSASSVFLTPPSTGRQHAANSIEKAVRIPCFPRCTEKIPFSLSLEAEELDHEYRFDILKELHLRKLQHTVIKHILDYLDDLSLLRASHVCKTWWNVIRGVNGVEKGRIEGFISKKLEYCKEQGKENVGIQKRARNYAHSILENTPKSPAKIFKPSTDLNILKFRPCPKCNSPAKISQMEIAHCEQCCEEFCLKCFRKTNGHSSESCVKTYTPMTVTSKQRKSKGELIGSKQNKKRLRRLSRGTKKS